MTADFSEKQHDLMMQMVIANASLTREGIAKSMGKNKLNPSEITQLEELVSMGYVHKETVLRGIKESFLYSLTDAGKQQLQ